MIYLTLAFTSARHFLSHDFYVRIPHNKSRQLIFFYDNEALSFPGRLISHIRTPHRKAGKPFFGQCQLTFEVLAYNDDLGLFHQLNCRLSLTLTDTVEWLPNLK